MMWQLIVLLVAVTTTHSSEKKQNFSFVGNPLLHVRPCNGSEEVTIEYEPGRPPGSENEYNVYIREELSAHSKILIKFDSEASVTLSEASSAAARVSTIGKVFYINFFKSTDHVSFKVVGPASGIIPYMTSIVINTVQYCENPDKGYLDNYVLGYRPAAETQTSSPDESCGRRKVQHTELITNGLATKPGDWPWHAAIYRLDKDNIKYICGGTLISKTFILTAAHCVTIRGVPVLPEILSVVLGKYNLIGGDVAAQEREIHQVIVNDEFTYNQHLKDDIALLKLKTEAVFDDYVQPACMWYTDVLKKVPQGTLFGTVVGWGFDQTDTLSSQLRQAVIPKVSEVTCIKSNPLFYANVLTNRKFCAGWKNGTSACNGDSGGGFIVFAPDTAGDTSPSAPGTWHVRGIVSLSVSRRDVALCDPTQYVVFTDIAKYKGWLRTHVKDL